MDRIAYPGRAVSNISHLNKKEYYILRERERKREREKKREKKSKPSDLVH